MVYVSRHDDILGEQRGPGVTRKLTLGAQNGAGAITTGMVFLEPGGTIMPHTHLVEEAMTLIEGRLKILVGTETTEVDAGTSWLAPGNTVHGARNIGDGQAVLLIAYPAIEVKAFPAQVEF
ncbi:MAG: cupin domain-containing protein [Chloroflexi bacterium]|nr:cupin domain-containing protein [Chloroflexota bacterium]